MADRTIDPGGMLINVPFIMGFGTVAAGATDLLGAFTGSQVRAATGKSVIGNRVAVGAFQSGAAFALGRQMNIKLFGGIGVKRFNVAAFKIVATARIGMTVQTGLIGGFLDVDSSLQYADIHFSRIRNKAELFIDFFDRSHVTVGMACQTINIFELSAGCIASGLGAEAHMAFSTSAVFGLSVNIGQFADPVDVRINAEIIDAA